MYIGIVLLIALAHRFSSVFLEDTAFPSGQPELLTLVIVNAKYSTCACNDLPDRLLDIQLHTKEFKSGQYAGDTR